MYNSRQVGYMHESSSDDLYYWVRDPSFLLSFYILSFLPSLRYIFANIESRCSIRTIALTTQGSEGQVKHLLDSRVDRRLVITVPKHRSFAQTSDNCTTLHALHVIVIMWC